MAAKRSRGSDPRIRLADLGEGAEAPELAVFAVDASGEAIQSAPVGADGKFSLSDATLKKAHEVVVGPNVDDLADVDRSTLARFRVSYIQDLIASGEALEIPESKWGRFHFHRTCVDGSVRHCWPFFLRERLLESARPEVAAFERGELSAEAATLDSADLVRVSDSLKALPLTPLPHFPACEVVCHGIVEVYRRTCCCEPWIYLDPRFEDMLKHLKELIEDIPPFVQWPPPPPPPPDVEIDQLGVIKSGVLSEAHLNARRDLHALSRLDAREAAEYVRERAYLRPLWCHCGPPQKVGQGTLQPDGSFHICWNDPIFRPFPHCHDSYAFVVKQSFNDQTITIYDGIVGNEWFSSRTGIQLTSWDRRARGCRDNDFPGDGGSNAFVLLQDIGAAHSYRLKTPDADGAFSVASPVYNDGLLDPAPTAAAALGNSQNSNWGGRLALRYHFSESMRALGARYYRISVCAANSSGDPTGTRRYLGSDPGEELSWLYYEVVGTDIFVRSAQLGPQTHPAGPGGNANLFEIPFDADPRDWQDGQFHGVVDTTPFTEGRYLITLEVFNAAGNPIRPNGTAGPGATAAFTFRRWYQPTGPTQEVPFAALTHMFWWDNRPAEAQIVDVRKDHTATPGNCQFLVGPDNTLFSATYRAYHQDPLFIYNHSMWWTRGLGGATGTLVSSPQNAGHPPAAPAETPTSTSPPSPTFADMLGPEMKCSFALNLHVNVKTTDGSGRLSYLDASRQGAFALERTGP
jgi:hypothetical protein